MVIGTLPTAAISENDYMAFYDVSASEEPKQRKITLTGIINLIKSIMGALPEAVTADEGKPVVVGSDGSFQLGASIKKASELIYVATSDWQQISDSEPFTYYAEKTIISAITADSTVELINDNPILFAKYGFAISSVNNQTIRFLCYNLPPTSVVLRVIVHG